MNIQPLNVDALHARAALREYKANRSVYDRRDWEIERIYRQIAKGKTVISVNDAIVGAGLDEKRRPRLAICEAHAVQVVCDCHGDTAVFGVHDPAKGSLDRGTGRLTIQWPGVGYFRPGIAALPRIPPQHRPASGTLGNYHILWEADWHDIPRDPYLLKRIGKDAWVVLAVWDLTDVEVNVLRARR